MKPRLAILLLAVTTASAPARKPLWAKAGYKWQVLLKMPIAKSWCVLNNEVKARSNAIPPRQGDRMFQNPEQFANATKTLFEFQLETFNTLTNRAMQGVEQAVALNIATARKALDDQIDAGRKVNASATPQEALDVINARLQPGMAATNAYNQQLGALLSEMSNEFHKAADAHLAEAKSNLSALIYDVTKNVPPGSDNAVQIVKTAIDNAFKGYEQVTQATRDAVTAFEQQLEKANAAGKK